MHTRWHDKQTDGLPPLRMVSPLLTSLTASSAESHTFVFVGIGASTTTEYSLCLGNDRHVRRGMVPRGRVGRILLCEALTPLANIVPEAYDNLCHERVGEMIYAG